MSVAIYLPATFLVAAVTLAIHWLYRRRVDWLRLALYVAGLDMLLGLNESHTVPPPLAMGLALLLGWLYWSTKDDDDHKRRKRLRSAWKRTREYLAYGIPAARPEATKA